jgi:uncharacterized NAD(P)/FAD-binding protein YdhS
MTAEPKVPVAIVGGGFAGTMLAANLARRGIASALIEGSGRAGQGAAYSTSEPSHLLNIPAERMSAWEDDPDDFARCVEAEGGSRHDFVERRRFGVYLSNILARAVADGFVQVVQANANGAIRSGASWRVDCDDGTAIESEALALAIGNQQPRGIAAFSAGGDRYIDNPWSEDARRAITRTAAEGSNVLMIGTGLTMVDCALSLDAAGFGGRAIAMSRRGQLPRANLAGPAPRPSADPRSLPKGDLRALVRWLRQESGRIGWRDAIDSLRPHSHAVWQSLSHESQRRFLRHARAFWDVHRHRIAPEVAHRIAQMIADGRLEIMAARVVGVDADDNGLGVRYRRRGDSGERALRVGLAINCTGPLHAMSQTRDPLLAGLIAAGEARPDALDIGLATDSSARVIGSDRLWALGALTKANYWEIIAVPDIRVQAAAVADDIARELDR